MIETVATKIATIPRPYGIRLETEIICKVVPISFIGVDQCSGTSAPTVSVSPYEVRGPSDLE